MRAPKKRPPKMAPTSRSRNAPPRTRFLPALRGGAGAWTEAGGREPPAAVGTSATGGIGGRGGGAVLRPAVGGGIDSAALAAASSSSCTSSRASILSIWIVAFGSTRFSKSLTIPVLARTCPRARRTCGYARAGGSSDDAIDAGTSPSTPGVIRGRYYQRADRREPGRLEWRGGSPQARGREAQRRRAADRGRQAPRRQLVSARVRQARQGAPGRLQGGSLGQALPRAGRGGTRHSGDQEGGAQGGGRRDRGFDRSQHGRDPGAPDRRARGPGRRPHRGVQHGRRGRVHVSPPGRPGLR